MFVYVARFFQHLMTNNFDIHFWKNIHFFFVVIAHARFLLLSSIDRFIHRFLTHSFASSIAKCNRQRSRFFWNHSNISLNFEHYKRRFKKIFHHFEMYEFSKRWRFFSNECDQSQCDWYTILNVIVKFAKYWREWRKTCSKKFNNFEWHQKIEKNHWINEIQKCCRNYLNFFEWIRSRFLLNNFESWLFSFSRTFALICLSSSQFRRRSFEFWLSSRFIRIRIWDLK